jgi:UDP-glucose 4-epimerase
MDRIIKECDVIVHLAASTLRTSLVNPKRTVNINVSGTMNILEAARNHGVKKVIYSSASSVYGIPQYLPVDEDHPKNPTTVYGVSKLSCEHLLRVYNTLYGMSYLIFRFTNVYGPRQRVETGGLIPVVLTRMLKGEEIFVYGDGSQTRDFVYVEDVVNMITQAVLNEEFKNETFNLGSGKQTSIIDVINGCSSILKIQPKLIHKPEEGGERKGFQADMNKCMKSFGVIPDTPVDEGIRETANWISENI